MLDMVEGLGLKGRDSGAGGRYRAKAAWDYGDARAGGVRVEAGTERNIVFGEWGGVTVTMIGKGRGWGIGEDWLKAGGELKGMNCRRK